MNTTGKEHAIRVLIVDDHPVVREGLASLIERHPKMTVVGLARNGREAIELFRQQPADVTLMDLRMPEVDGVEAITTIREEYPDARIIVLTTYSGDAEIYRGLHAGAKGYLLKDVEGDELLEAITAVHAGKSRIPSDIAGKLAEHISGPRLTAREMEVLELIVAGKSNQEIGEALFITEGTVKGHVNNILTKLDVSDRTQAVSAAIKRGIIRLE